MLDPDITNELDGFSSSLAQSMNYLKEFGVNIKRNGAVGDGVLDVDGNYVSGTDDSDIIQGIIDDVSSLGGGTVYVPDYVFIITKSLKMKSNVKLIGTGTIKCIGVFSGSGSQDLAAINIRDNQKQIENITVKGLKYMHLWLMKVSKVMVFMYHGQKM
jgi:hypothetical protein